MSFSQTPRDFWGPFNFETQPCIPEQANTDSILWWWKFPQNGIWFSVKKAFPCKGKTTDHIFLIQQLHPKLSPHVAKKTSHPIGANGWLQHGSCTSKKVFNISFLVGFFLKGFHKSTGQYLYLLSLSMFLKIYIFSFPYDRMRWYIHGLIHDRINPKAKET